MKAKIQIHKWYNNYNILRDITANYPARSVRIILTRFSVCTRGFYRGTAAG